MVPSPILSDVLLFSFQIVPDHFKGAHIFKSYTIKSEHDRTNIKLIGE